MASKTCGMKIWLGFLVFSSAALALTGYLPNSPILSLLETDAGSPFIMGRCLCPSKEDETAEVPCSDVGIQLLDVGSNKERKIKTSDGEFVFPAEKDHAYEIRITSLHEVVSIPHSVKIGDDVTLRLKPTVKSEQEAPKSSSKP